MKSSCCSPFNKSARSATDATRKTRHSMKMLDEKTNHQKNRCCNHQQYDHLWKVYPDPCPLGQASFFNNHNLNERDNYQIEYDLREAETEQNINVTCVVEI
jgi:hypothetical protein